MNEEWRGIERRKNQRAEAEHLVANLSPELLKANPAEVLLHELLVHKVELEMQNEELRQSHNALLEARNRYLDLYNFAPISYITVTREDAISEINLSGAEMLGVERDKLINQRFSRFVAPQDSDQWHREFMKIMEAANEEKHAFRLVMKSNDGAFFQARLDCLRRESSEHSPILRIALTNLSKACEGVSANSA
jgi:PAS domain S-box-containing protein